MATFKDIQQANAEIKTMAITRWDKKLGKEVSKDYAEVNQRIKAFRMVYPDGFIMTDIISHDNGVVVMQAKAGYYGSNGEVIILGTGYAFEDKKNGLINSTSYIENCETSAIGRALGMCGFGIDVSVASYEEVKNAIAQQEAKKFTCAACGNTFTDAKVAEQTMKRWGKHICKDCIKKKQEELKKNAKPERAEAVAEPVPPMFQPEPEEQIKLPFEI